MRSRNQTVSDTGGRADVFITRHVDVLPNTNASPVRQQLVVQLGMLRSTGGTQLTEKMGAVGATSLTATMRDVLFRKYLAPVVTMANALMPKTDAFKGLVLPNQHLGTGKLLTAVDGIVGIITPNIALFTAAGLDPNFLAQLTGAAEAVRMSVTASSNRRGGRITATSALDLAAMQVMKIIRTLDRMVRAELDGNTAVLADWINAKRLGGFSSTSAAAPAAAAAPAPVPASTTPAPVAFVGSTPAAATTAVTTKTGKVSRGPPARLADLVGGGISRHRTPHTRTVGRRLARVSEEELATVVEGLNEGDLGSATRGDSFSRHCEEHDA